MGESIGYSGPVIHVSTLLEGGGRPQPDFTWFAAPIYMALCEDAYLGGALAGKQKVFYCLGQNPAAGKCLHYSI